jgi:hypothetical protein
MQPPSPIAPGQLGKMFAALQNSNVPFRRPSWNDPSWWSRPLNSTIIIPLSGGSAWSDILTIRGRNNYGARVTGYVATTYGAADVADVDFRFVYNGALISTIDFVSTVERNRETPTMFPTFPQKFFFLLNLQTDVLTIQAKNNGTYQQLLMCAFYGYYFDNKNQAERSTMEGMTDA